MRPNPGVELIRPYQGGKPIEEVRRELGLTDVVKMASNENPLGPSKLAVEAISEAARAVHYYPDGNAYYMKQALAEHLGVSPEQLLLGNGSNEVIQVVGETFLKPGDHVVYSDQAFVVYDLMSKVFGARVSTPPLRDQTHDLDAMADAVTDETRLVLIANPNNPTGTYVGRDALDRFFSRVSDDVLVVLDEAYFEYVEEDDYPDGLEYLKRGKNVIVTRTFSKIYGLAGVRLGYGVASPELVNWLNRVRQPFNVNSLAQAAGLGALRDSEHVRRSREVNREGMTFLTGELARLGLGWVPSVANFLLVDVDRDGGAVSQALMRLGVIVRPMQGYRFPKSIRVTIGLPSENRLFISALEAVLAEIPAASGT